MIKKGLFYFLGLILIFNIIPVVSYAQTSQTINSLEMNIVPENPEPLQNVKFTLKSVSFDINRAQITWYVGGQEKTTGIGKKEFNIIAGKNGEKTTVKAVIAPQDRAAVEISGFFIPSSVDLIYESLSYVPPFYKGKAMNPNQGVVLVVAIPNLLDSFGTKIPTEKVVYSWKQDGRERQSVSGLGKNTYIFSGGVPIRDVVVEVVASSLDSTIFSSKKIEISNYSPKIIFYENSPIYGLMLNRAIKNDVNLLNDEFSVIATPYFFSAGYALTPDLDYLWTLNGKTVGNQEQKNIFTTRQVASGSGTAKIGLKISNNVRIFQFTNNDYTINFEKQ